MLRFGETSSNSSMSAITRRATDLRRLASELGQIGRTGFLPVLDPAEVSVVDDWYFTNWGVPVLTGRIAASGLNSPNPADVLKFTGPIHLFSWGAGMARSSRRWYRLGAPSILAADTLSQWENFDPY